MSFVRTWVEKGAHYDPDDQLRLVQISPAYLHLAPALQSRHGVLILAVRDRPERIVLPDSLREQAFAAAHDSPPTGHLGIQKTLQTLKERFFFPSMQQYVRRMVTTCLPCVQKRSTITADHPAQHP